MTCASRSQTSSIRAAAFQRKCLDLRNFGARGCTQEAILSWGSTRAAARRRRSISCGTNARPGAVRRTKRPSSRHRVLRDSHVRARSSASVIVEVVIGRLQDDGDVNLKKSLARRISFFHEPNFHSADAYLRRLERSGEGRVLH